MVPLLEQRISLREGVDYVYDANPVRVSRCHITYLRNFGSTCLFPHNVFLRLLLHRFGSNSDEIPQYTYLFLFKIDKSRVTEELVIKTFFQWSLLQIHIKTNNKDRIFSRISSYVTFKISFCKMAPDSIMNRNFVLKILSYFKKTLNDY